PLVTVREDQHLPGALQPDRTAEPEHHHALVLADDLDGIAQEEQDEHDDHARHDQAGHAPSPFVSPTGTFPAGLPTSLSVMGSTTSFTPRTRVIRTGEP